MATAAVMHPNDGLKRQFSIREKNYRILRNRRKKQVPEHAISTEKCEGEVPVGNNLVMGKVQILKRGETLETLDLIKVMRLESPERNPAVVRSESSEVDQMLNSGSSEEDLKEGIGECDSPMRDFFSSLRRRSSSPGIPEYRAGSAAHAGSSYYRSPVPSELPLPVSLFKPL